MIFAASARTFDSHYENTPFYYGSEAASGLFEHPYRPRPYQWYNNRTGELYVNERNTGVEKSGISFIAQIRRHMPAPLRALIWMGVDDASTTPRFPAYACSVDVSSAYKGFSTAQGHVRPILQFDLSKAFWVQNLVSNFAYMRWRDAYPVIKARLNEIHNDFVSQVKQMDEKVLELYSTDPDAAILEATQFSMDVGDQLHREWFNFFGTLFARFRDFVTTEVDPTNLACGCKTTEVGMTNEWKERIIKETGRHYWMVDDTPNMIGMDSVPATIASSSSSSSSSVMKRDHEKLHAERNPLSSKDNVAPSHMVLLIAMFLSALVAIVGKFALKHRMRKNKDSYSSLESMVSLEEANEKTPLS